MIDFIDMVLPANRELLLRRLVECLGRDRTRHQVAEVTSLGLVQMTRKKIGTGLAEAFTVACETCKGRGYHVHDAPVASQAPADGGERDSRRRGPAVVAATTRRNARARKEPEPSPEPVVEPVAAPVADAVPEPTVEAIVETAVEAPVEPAVEVVVEVPVVEAVTAEATQESEPVVVEPVES